MTAWILIGLAVVSAGLVVWAAITGRPAGDPRPVRVPRHAHWTGDGATTRLVPPTLEPPEVTQDIPAPYPRAEDMPWRAHDDRPHNAGTTAD